MNEQLAANSELPAAQRHAPGKRWLQGVVEDLGMRAVAFGAAGLNRLLGGQPTGVFGILMYHRVAASVPGLPQPTINVPPARFRQQLEGLLQQRFQFWSLRRVLACHAGGQPVPPRVAVVTFDDGFEGVYTHAWPVLRELNIPSTTFLSTAYLDAGCPFPFDHWGVRHSDQAPQASYRPLALSQCREMAEDPLVDFGAHTHTHEDFRGRAADFQLDLLACVDCLHSEFGRREVPFAFPYGDPGLGFVTDELVAAARQTGVTCALTTASLLVDPRTDPFSWGRLNVFAWDTADTLAAKLNGWYSWAPRHYRRLKAFVRGRPGGPTPHNAPTETPGSLNLCPNR